MTDKNDASFLVNRGIDRGGVLLHNYDDALSLVQHCIQNNIKILGIDAFYVTDHSTQPVMEHSVDYSRSDMLCNNERAYLFLLKKKDLGLYFEVVY